MVAKNSYRHDQLLFWALLFSDDENETGTVAATTGRSAHIRQMLRNGAAYSQFTVPLLVEP